MKALRNFVIATTLTTFLATSADADVITETTGVIAGTDITWQTPVNNGISFGPNGLVGSTGRVGSNGGFADIATITFSAPVDLTIGPHGSSQVGNFSNLDANNTFAANAGSWTFTPGEVNPIFPLGGSDDAPFFTTSGSSLITNRATGGNFPNSFAPPIASEDWGQFSINGITSITWAVTDGAFIEAFSFAATAAVDGDATGVPEPASAVLLGLGILGLVSRRRR